MDIDILDGDDIHLGSSDQGARQAPKVILLEFALVRHGSNCDLPCEEAPEASMFLEPLPTPRGPHAQYGKRGGHLHVLHKHSRKPRQHQPSSEGGEGEGYETVDLRPPADITVCQREVEEEVRCYWETQHSDAAASSGQAS